jgi:GTPase SAR1 family protein
LENKALKATRKVVLLGLDSAGKSSIILALNREMDKISIVQPTKGAQRRVFDFLNLTVIEHDLGGQQHYRQDYLTNPKFLDMTDIAIYVIDVQNKNRVVESLNFLNAIIKRFKEIDIKPFLYIFFHKFDPVKTEKAQDELNNLSLYLEHRIKESIEYEKICFYKTSIFDLSSIINAMSSILLSLYPKANVLEKTIEDFAEKFKAEGIEIVDNNSLIIAAFYKNDQVKEILNKSTHYFLSLNDILLTSKEGSKTTNLMQIERMGKFFLFKQFSFNNEAPPYHILLYKNDQIFDIEQFDTLVSILKGILYN